MLRDYQQKAVYAINRDINQKRDTLFVSPTGTGKTKTASAVIGDQIRLRRRKLVVAPQIEIFKQWLNELAVSGHNPGYINDTGIRGVDRSVYVCMQKSLCNILSFFPEKLTPDIIIIDEAHHSGAETYEKIFNHFPEATRLGLTATPYRYDNKPLGNYFNNIIETITMQEAIDQKFLAQPLVIVPEEYKLNVRMQNGEFDKKEQAELLGDPRIIGNVIEQYSLIFQGLPVIVACSTFEHAKKITESFCAAGWSFEHIHSKLHPAARSSILKRIISGKTNGICTVGIGIEGLDIPGLYGLIWMRRTMSLTIYLQFTGRVLRPFPGKEFGIIIDGVGNTFIHGRPELHRTWSLYNDYEIKQDDGIPSSRLCPVCGVMTSNLNVLCHVCGFNFLERNLEGIIKKRKYPIMIDGKLVVLEDENKREEFSKRIKEQRKQQAAEEKKEPEPEILELDRMAKIDILKNGLLKDTKFSDLMRRFG